MHQKTYDIAILISRSRSGETAYPIWDCDWVGEVASRWALLFTLPKREFALTGLDANVILYDATGEMTPDEYIYALSAIVSQNVVSMDVDNWRESDTTVCIEFEERYYDLMERKYKWL